MKLRQWLRESGRYHAVFIVLTILAVPWECCT
jgi:hypothetical protein